MFCCFVALGTSFPSSRFNEIKVLVLEKTLFQHITWQTPLKPKMEVNTVRQSAVAHSNFLSFFSVRPPFQPVNEVNVEFVSTLVFLYLTMSARFN